jgi:hypothetical protein
MKISDERARAIAESAIAYEAAKDKASAKLVEWEKFRTWDYANHTYIFPFGEEAWNKADYALYNARSDRDGKRRAYQRQIKSALLEAVSD